VPELDEWIRRRLRMCYWKQWRRCRTRVGELLKLGVSQRQAVMTALSRKDYWHLSRTQATQWGLNNAWLESHKDWSRCATSGSLSITRQHISPGDVPCHGNPSEPPDADPHVRWCGRGELITPPDPISA
jgi:hypothetical protein